MKFLGAERQAGYPSINATDAQRGNSAMAYHSADVLSGSREGDGSILVLTEGTHARADAGLQSELAQRGKVGCCPRFTKATRNAVPPRYQVGGFSKDKTH